MLRDATHLLLTAAISDWKAARPWASEVVRGFPSFFSTESSAAYIFDSKPSVSSMPNLPKETVRPQQAGELSYKDSRAACSNEGNHEQEPS